MPTNSKSVVTDAALAAYPNEACGLLIDEGKKRPVWVACKNSSHDPKEQFRIDPIDYAIAASRGRVIGVWHTHVDRSAEPSDADKVGCEVSGVPWYIFPATASKVGQPTVFGPTGFQMPYIGRPYVFGIFDCWSLVRDYHARELGIALEDRERTDDFWKRGENLLGDNWEAMGFTQLFDVEPQVGDVFMIQTDTPCIPNHLAIYVGDDKILHHCHGRLSCHDVYGGGYWQKHTVGHFRMEKKC